MVESFLNVTKKAAQVLIEQPFFLNYLLNASVKTGTICFLRDTTPSRRRRCYCLMKRHMPFQPHMPLYQRAKATESLVRISVTTNRNKSIPSLR